MIQSKFMQELASLVKKIQHYPAKYPEYNGGCTEDEPLQVIELPKIKRKRGNTEYINGKSTSNMTLAEYRWATRFRKPVAVPKRYDLLEYYPKRKSKEERDKETKLIDKFISTAKYKYRAIKKGQSPCIIYTNKKMYGKK